MIMLMIVPGAPINDSLSHDFRYPSTPIPPSRNHELWLWAWGYIIEPQLLTRGSLEVIILRNSMRQSRGKLWVLFYISHGCLMIVS